MWSFTPPGVMKMEEIMLSLKHYWCFVDSEVLELQGLSWGGRAEHHMNTG